MRRVCIFAAVATVALGLYPATGTAETADDATRAATTVSGQLNVRRSPSPEVAFEILEGIPDNRTWNYDLSEPTARFTGPAFALSDLPKKYIAPGVIADRQAPFLLRGRANIAIPLGEHRLLLRARGAARLFIDGQLVAQTKFRKPSDDGHGTLPELPAAHEPGLALLPPDNQEQLVPFSSPGGVHRVRLEAIVADQKLRPELGELSVSISHGSDEAAVSGEPSFQLLAPQQPSMSLSESNWSAYKAAERARLAEVDAQARAAAGEGELDYWRQRHASAREYWKSQAEIGTPEVSTTGEASGTRGREDSALTPIDQFLLAGQSEAGRQFTAITDDYAFLRRVSLDTTGVIPSPAEIAALVNDRSPDRRARAIDRLLADPRWADHWTSYWQDVLAENPGIVKPELNNSGPFRYWIHESLLDNKPFDRFATELVMMQGSSVYGGPAGFGIASQNDAPMAEKAHVLAKAFLAVELKCARCHDAPYHPFTQKDTFSLAAMLDRKSQKLPKTSTVVVAEGSRQPLITISLKPGDTIEPGWALEHLVQADFSTELLRNREDTREQFAVALTGPRNRRFAEVIVNRLWTRYIGWGLVNDTDDWHEAERHYPELLEYLARDFILHGYDLKHLARVILNSRLYQSEVAMAEAEKRRESPLAPARRRLSAEQVVDSLFVAVDEPFNAEMLTFDPAGRSGAKNFGNLGVPTRAWQFTSLSNERDRPALALPAAQSIVDVLIAFGWRESRQNPLTVREESPNVLQPLIVGNGVAATRVTSLSDDSEMTRLALSDRSVHELVRDVYLRILSRPPSDEEHRMFVDLLSSGYTDRRRGEPSHKTTRSDKRVAVAWSNHHSPEATRIKIEMERAARAGDPPTERLDADWRMRMEDMVWALVNSPEFVFVP